MDYGDRETNRKTNKTDRQHHRVKVFLLSPVAIKTSALIIFNINGMFISLSQTSRLVSVDGSRVLTLSSNVR